MVGEEQYNNIWDSSESENSESLHIVRGDSEFEDANVSDEHQDDDPDNSEAAELYGLSPAGNVRKHMEPIVNKSLMLEKTGIGRDMNLESSLSMYKLEEYQDYEKLVKDVMKIQNVSD
jgi:hypothetical protein